ncbi:hypothetical protein GWK91_07535 [Virgibacillus sp. MSP4-1]|uniref:YpjP family protein n=1 Tax=Virgibacillus sp. MSP4-1 TaxID=2700081 RepID=UPI0003A707B7|nr:YpjP family protein [Virgibacillus sp. MSP4-1]QHS22804.1 hypothetical protein GWK91_07535 [Virgibacillus sp. MSP4-1]
MKPEIKKFLLIAITILTLGMYTPPALLEADAAESEEVDSSKTKSNNDTQTENDTITHEINDYFNLTNFHAPQADDHHTTQSALTEIAKEQTKAKLGPKIMDQVEDDFITEILPNIEKTIHTLLKNIDKQDIRYYGVSEEAVSGYGEKIFVLYDVRTNNEIARFDVRRENRPHEGYWFNFHYHLEEDQFEKHYNIGEIYYDKNTPPRWMS